MNYIENINKGISFLPESDKNIAYEFVLDRKFEELKTLIETIKIDNLKVDNSEIDKLYTIVIEYISFMEIDNIEEDDFQEF